MNNFNTITLTGKITEVGPSFLAKNGDVCARCDIETVRLSTTVDILPLIISDKLIKHDELLRAANSDNSFTVKGEIRTTNALVNNKHTLRQYVYVNDIKQNDCDTLSENELKLTGIICKPIQYRHTPLGKLIADVFVAHNPTDKRTSYYVPCIAWGSTAVALTNLSIGDKINITGRYQSRWYKKIINDKVEDKLALEVSINSYEVVE